MKRFVQTDASGNVTAIAEADKAPNHPHQSDITNGPAVGSFGTFNHGTQTFTPTPPSQAEKEMENNRTRLKTLASKGGKNLTQQDRDEILTLRTLMDLGEL